MNIVDRGNADTADATVDEHLASAAFANTALQATWFAVEAVTMDRETGLMQGGSNGVAPTSLYSVTIKKKLDNFRLRNVENGMVFDSIHSIKVYGLIIYLFYVYLKPESKNNNINPKRQEKKSKKNLHKT